MEELVASASRFQVIAPALMLRKEDQRSAGNFRCHERPKIAEVSRTKTSGKAARDSAGLFLPDVN